MAIYKNKDIETNINERGAELGNINVNFYTEDNGTASIRIKMKKQDGTNVDFTKTDMLPRLDLYAKDGSIFTKEPVSIILPEQGFIQYKVSDYVIRHEGKMDCKLFLDNGTESVHVANFYFTIKDSGVTGAVGKEIHVDILEDMVRKVMTDNAMGLLDDEYKEKINQDVVDYVASNPDKYKGPKGDNGLDGAKGEKGPKGDTGIQGPIGPKGESLKYSDLTTQQKEELKSNITNQAVTDFVLEDGAITTDKVSDKSVTPNKTTFAKASKNLFNVNNSLKDKQVNLSTGVVESVVGWYASDFILIEKSVEYKRSKYAQIVTFDANKEYLSSYGNSDIAIKMPSNVAYVRLNIQSANLNEFQFEKGNVTTTYEEYGITLDNLKLTEDSILKKSITGDKIKNGAIEKSKVSFIQESDNLFNINSVLLDKNLGDTGVISDNINYVVSEYIEVKQGETYGTNNKNFGYVLYDENKHYINGRGQSLSNITIPNNVSYIRLNINNNSLPEFKFFNIENTDIKEYSIDISNKPVITGKLNEAISYNKETLEPLKTNKDFEVIDIMNSPNRTISSAYSRVSDSFEKTYRNNIKSFKLQTLGNTTSELRVTPSSPIDVLGVQEFDVEVYIDDASKIKTIEFNISKNEGGSWSTTVSDLVNGWNKLRFYTNQGNISTWDKAKMFRFIVYPLNNADTTVYVSDIKAIKPAKAKIIIVNDHGYSGFKQIAFPKLEELEVPTTFAINPGRLGMPISGATSILSQEEIDELAISPYAEFSWHTWNPQEKATKDMTSTEIKKETAKCIYYLKKNGLMPTYLWRAAFVQNLAPNHNAIDNMVEAYASWNEGNSFEAYPFKDSRNIRRILIHGRSNADFDSYFDTLKKTRCLAVFYTHDITDNGGIHMTNAELDYFVSKIKQGVEEGWLEGTTYSELRTRYEIDRNSSGINDFFSGV